MSNGKNTGKNESVDHRRQDVRQAVKNACDQMRNDGVDPRNYVEQLAWLFFLKAFDETESRLEQEAAFNDETYERRLSGEYKWSQWSTQVNRPDEMLKFVNDRLWDKLLNSGNDPIGERFRRIFENVKNHSRRGASIVESGSNKLRIFDDLRQFAKYEKKII